MACRTPRGKESFSIWKRPGSGADIHDIWDKEYGRGNSEDENNMRPHVTVLSSSVVEYTSSCSEMTGREREKPNETIRYLLRGEYSTR